MNLDYDIVKYKNKKYAVIKVLHKKISYPGLIDYSDLDIIRRIKKKWRCNMYGFISCSHTYNNETKDVYLHEIIMVLKQQEKGEEEIDSPIIHINNIGLDNRRGNLIYDTSNKNIRKNSRKKRRTITLPPESGIDPAEIPTYVWYMKPDKTHGERFMVSVGNIKWKTTSSKKISLRYKLEEAKMYLRQHIDEDQKIFDDYSMNGDYTKLGRKLMKSYYDIIHLAKYNHIKRYTPQNRTNNYLKEGKISRIEKQLLKLQGNLGQTGGKNRRVKNNLPKKCGIKSNDLPKYSYYRPPYKGRGSFFIVNSHPQQNKKIWQTTSSKKVSIKDKYNQLLEYIDKLKI